MSIYTVKKHRGAWAVCSGGDAVMLFDSYEEAVDLAQTAVRIMVHRSEVRCRWNETADDQQRRRASLS
jgi:hypothetical protein